MRLITLSIFVALISCAPGPRRTLTETEKVTDMYWLFSKFDHNYAPIQMKEKLHGFNYEELKAKYLEEAKLTKSNDEFFLVMHKFVAEFKDAHTGGQVQTSSLPGRTKYAYLGFKGKRTGSNLTVKELLPTINSAATKYPIKVDDQVIAINDIPLKKYVDEEISQYRNLGNKQANYTGLFNAIFNRSSYSMPLPKEANVKLTLKRQGKKIEVEVPWVIKDLVSFRKEQAEAIKAAQVEKLGANYNLNLTEADFEQMEKLAGLVEHKFINKAKIQNILRATKDFDEIFKAVANSVQEYSALDSFELPHEYNLWDIVGLLKNYLAETNAINAEDSLSMIKKSVKVIGKPYHVAGSSVYPAYMSNITHNGKDFKVGYIKLHSFSVGAPEEAVLKEVKNTLTTFKDFGVESVVIDLLNNGGGSLSLGINLAQALTHKKIDLPGIQYKLNETWLDNFEKASITNNSDAEKELASRAYTKMLESFNMGQDISSAMSIKSLYPFSVTPNSTLMKNNKPYDFKYFLLVNEMCASMCDIFSAMIQDNKLGTLIGNQTMGAGGNVTTHTQAPNSGFIVRQTESLIVRSRDQKDYLENQGVIPDIKINTYEATGLYDEVIDRVLKEITGDKKVKKIAPLEASVPKIENILNTPVENDSIN